MKNADDKNLHSNKSFSSDNKELNKLRLVFEQTPGAIFILDREFRFEYVNPSFTRLSGYTKEELIGKQLKNCFITKMYLNREKKL
jgi:PAS domain S-box-containing protein